MAGGPRPPALIVFTLKGPRKTGGANAKGAESMARRVLLAEDEANIVESLRFLFQRAGFEVTVAADGRVALQAALTDPPDVMVLDLMLPGIDGLAILRALRGDARGARLPVIMLSARGQRDCRAAAIDEGADLFIAKPFSNSEVVAAVTRLADGRRA